MHRAAPEPKLCRLEQAIGVDAVCTEQRCPFWEPGGAVLEGRCVFEGVDLAQESDVAQYLLAIRERLRVSGLPPMDAGHDFRRALSDSRE